jgi:Mce-associated membrane protein
MTGTPRRRIAGESKPDIGRQPAEAAKPLIPTFRRRGEAASPKSSPEPSGSAVVRKPSPLIALFRSPKALALIGVLALSLAFGAFGTVTGIHTWNADSVSGNRSEATDAAETAAETIFTYRYDQLPQYLSAAQATMTPANAKKFKTVFPAFRKLVPQRKIQMKGVVRNAAVVECGESCSPDKATVLVFLDQARLADGVKKVTVFPLRFKMEMVKRHDRWLVGDIKNL